MTSTLKSYHVRLTTRGFFDGIVEAVSQADAQVRTFEIWRTACPHPFEQSDDELISVEAEEVRPVTSATSDPRLVAIARNALGIPTLEPRGSDSLDFHTVSVWQVTAALQAASLSEAARDGVNADLLAIVRRFVETAEDYLPDGIEDPAYSPEAELLSQAHAVLAKIEGGAP